MALKCFNCNFRFFPFFVFQETLRPNFRLITQKRSLITFSFIWEILWHVQQETHSSDVYVCIAWNGKRRRGILTNLHKPAANICFSLITQIIIEIPSRQEIVAVINGVTSDGDQEPLARTTDYFSCNNSRLSS